MLEKLESSPFWTRCQNFIWSKQFIGHCPGNRKGWRQIGSLTPDSSICKTYRECWEERAKTNQTIPAHFGRNSFHPRGLQELLYFTLQYIYFFSACHKLGNTVISSFLKSFPLCQYESREIACLRGKPEGSKTIQVPEQIRPIFPLMSQGPETLQCWGWAEPPLRCWPSISVLVCQRRTPCVCLLLQRKALPEVWSSPPVSDWRILCP